GATLVRPDRPALQGRGARDGQLVRVAGVHFLGLSRCPDGGRRHGFYVDMNPRSFIYGIIVGALLTALGFLLFRGKVAETTSDMGRKVEHAGEKLKAAGDKLR